MGERLHPSNDIRGSKGSELADRKLVLCITGSVAAVRCPDLARELMRHGADVRVVMSPKATELITPRLMHWATGNPVITELTGKLEHVKLAQWADLVLVAPATANTLSKVACAIDDTSVTSVVSVALGLGEPVAMVPAMHESMYTHRLLQSNLTRPRDAGVHILEPRLEEGKAKLPEAGIKSTFIQGRDVVSQLFEVSKRSGRIIEIAPENSRCPMCNGLLKRASKQRVKGLVPETVLRVQREFWRCAKCGKTYWHGTHWKSIIEMASRYNRVVR